jgi:hypothetical protein
MKKVLTIAILTVITFGLAGCGQGPGIEERELTPEELRSQKEQAIQLASQLFQSKEEEGMDFSNGPCLAEEIIEDWSADIVHLPRNAEDNKPENQCQYYRKGKTHHFIELSLDGDLVRAK